MGAGGTAVVTTRDLTKHFGPVRAVEGLDVELRPGEVFGFLGPQLVVGLTAVGLVALVAAAPAVGLLDGVALVRVAGPGAALMALALLHASPAFAAGCAFGRRGIASATAGAVAVAGYLLVGLTAAAETPGALRWLSPWHWYLDRTLLVDAPPSAATLLPLALALAAAGGWRFVHRDLRLP